MKALFPYLSESIICEILKAKSDVVLKYFPHLSLNIPGAPVISIQMPLAFPNTNVSFDGFQNLDLGLVVDGGAVLPLEVKVGWTRLSKSNVDAMLDDCRISEHASNPRIAGNMLAVLNRNFKPELTAKLGESSLHACWTNGVRMPITDDWAIIARAKVIESWKMNRPNFNKNVRFITIEEICSAFGREEFNDLVRRMLDIDDYYSTWIDNQ